ncbi:MULTISPECIES: homoserine dehydrogenase [unclassified Pseudofrankia]|uniref:homoserine dehydrogenase n=1 Tax=unclassified Pseudofrankia TaxID=2994372 RepID=UPI0008DA09F0|nr:MULTISPECIES: homoserine dehydrogenase [unclassified Pseudofrankia]MDT3445273.1 homoserine dehydrogenase [Pseudofrankia sp. BMG5.37]OHV53276.1 homoserine dehydrogenase [Pseudofrankia sp. BMG5.36]
MRIALLGCGVVGSEVVRLLHEQADDLTARVGEPLELVGIAVRRPGRERDVPVDASLFTTDAAGLVARGDVDIVVEVVGGIEPARSWLLSALNSGKSVVSANKALLASDGSTLHDAAAAADVDLYYEAAVAGAIPLLRPLRESLAGDRVRRVLGIVNGTTNYILTRMDETGASFTEALEEAGALGYAEADPSADIDGYDAAAKAAILAQLAFHTRVTLDDVYREGIGSVTAADIASARAMGCTVKALAIAERSSERPGVSVRVHPAMVPRSHPLAAVREAFNAVFIEAEAAGQLMFYGRGAGGSPTASAVLGDLVAVARNRVAGRRGPGESAYAQLPVLPMGETTTSYHVNLDVTDKTGVLATVAGAFARHGVSIRSVRQDGRGDDASLVLVSHPAADAALAATVEDLRGLDIVRAVAGVLRVEGGEP